MGRWLVGVLKELVRRELVGRELKATHCSNDDFYASFYAPEAN